MTNEFKGLRHYIDIVEGKDQAVDEAGIMNALGQLGGAVAGTAANGVNAVGNAVSGAYDAAKQGVSNAANAVGNAVDAAGNAISGAVAPVVQGAKQGYAAATGAPATKPAGQSASPKAGGKPAAGKSDPAVLKLQQDLIAKGAKIKADGIMGPATQAAQKQFGAAAPAAAAPTAPSQAVDPNSQQAAMLAAQTAGMGLDAAPNGAAAAMAAPAAPAEKMADGGPAPTPEQLKWLGGADKTDPNILARMRSAVPNAPAAGATPPASPIGSAPGAVAPNMGQVNKGGYDPKAAQQVAESGYDEVQRLVSLVHYK